MSQPRNVRKILNSALSALSGNPAPVSTGAGKAARRSRQRKRRQARIRAGNNIPAAVGSSLSTNGASFSSIGDGRIRVSHREYLCDAVSRTTFVAQSWVLNPGFYTTFAWLANIANNYESYHFQRLDITYVPSVGTTVGGNVVLAVDFDAADPIAHTKQVLMSYHRAVRGPLYSPLTCSCGQADLSKFTSSRYVREAAVTGNLQNYDVGNLIAAFTSTTLADEAVCGEIYIDYVVDFMTPQAVAYDDIAIDNSSRLSTVAVNIDPANPFNGATTVGNLPLRIIDGNTFSLEKPGKYLLNLAAVGTALLEGTPLITGTDAAGALYSILRGGAGQLAFGAMFDKSTPGPITLDLTPCVDIGGGGTLGNVQIRLSPYSNS